MINCEIKSSRKCNKELSRKLNEGIGSIVQSVGPKYKLADAKMVFRRAQNCDDNRRPSDNQAQFKFEKPIFSTQLKSPPRTKTSTKCGKKHRGSSEFAPISRNGVRGRRHSSRADDRKCGNSNVGESLSKKKLDCDTRSRDRSRICIEVIEDPKDSAPRLCLNEKDSSEELSPQSASESEISTSSESHDSTESFCRQRSKKRLSVQDSSLCKNYARENVNENSSETDESSSCSNSELSKKKCPIHCINRETKNYYVTVFLCRKDEKDKKKHKNIRGHHK